MKGERVAIFFQASKRQGPSNVARFGTFDFDDTCT
jgi:hypothetical protein